MLVYTTYVHNYIVHKRLSQLKGKQLTVWCYMHLKQFTQTNHLHIQSIFSHQWSSQKVVLKWKNLATTADNMNLVDATNQNQASICTFGKIICRRVDCCHNKGEPSGALRRFTTKWQQQYATQSSSYGCSNSTGKDGISELMFILINHVIRQHEGINTLWPYVYCNFRFSCVIDLLLHLQDKLTHFPID